MTENEARAMVSLRMRPAALGRLNSLATEYNLHRSDVIRAALAVAQKNETEWRRALAEMEKRF